LGWLLPSPGEICHALGLNTKQKKTLSGENNTKLKKTLKKELKTEILKLMP
jgi:hypothetical protein